jgi:hypothetical protein
MKRMIVSALAGLTLFAGIDASIASAAAGPVARCASGWLLLPNEFPAQDAVDAKGNGDGYTCVKVLSTPNEAQAHFVINDNVVPF